MGIGSYRAVVFVGFAVALLLVVANVMAVPATRAATIGWEAAAPNTRPTRAVLAWDGVEIGSTLCVERRVTASLSIQLGCTYVAVARGGIPLTPIPGPVDGAYAPRAGYVYVIGGTAPDGSRWLRTVTLPVVHWFVQHLAIVFF